MHAYDVHKDMCLLHCEIHYDIFYVGGSGPWVGPTKLLKIKNNNNIFFFTFTVVEDKLNVFLFCL